MISLKQNSRFVVLSLCCVGLFLSTASIASNRHVTRSTATYKVDITNSNPLASYTVMYGGKTSGIKGTVPAASPHNVTRDYSFLVGQRFMIKLDGVGGEQMYSYTDHHKGSKIDIHCGGSTIFDTDCLRTNQ